MAKYFRIREQNKETGEVENVYVFETYSEVRNFAMNQEKDNKDYAFESEREIPEKELTTESIEGIVDIKHHLRFMEAKNNKDLIYVDKMVLRGLYNFFKLEGYSESHLSKVIYNETFEHKGIKY